jgi:hypothetical protein
LTGDSASQRDLPYIDLVDAQGNVQRSLALGERSVTIGSAPGNLLVLDGPSVARSHVRIDWDGQSAAVQNLATRRPTLYEGTPLQANDLRVWQPGELLQVGDYRLKLRMGGAAGGPESSSASQVTTPLSAIAANGAEANSLLDLRLDGGYDLLELTPDQMVAVKLTLTNRGTTPETAIISVEGPAAAWVRLPPTPVQVRPMGSVPLMLPVTVLRKPENRAGEYEVVIRARGQSSPSNSASAIGRWTVLPFSDARLELRPPTLKVRGTNSALYTVSMRNLGNVSMPFELRMTDDQQQLEFAPNISSGVIEPGATDERKVEVLPLRQPDDKEQTYNVRVQAAANGQTYSDSSTLIQRRGDFPEWAKWVLGGVFLLALLAIPALFLAYRTNAQNNANGTQVAMMDQTRNSMLTFEERTGTAASMGTQTVVAQTLQAVNAGLVNGPTSTVLSQINATAIAGSAQLTAQAAMIASSQAKPGNSTTNNNFFGDGVGGNSPAQATLGAVLQALQAASGQVSGAQTSQAVQNQAGAVAQTAASQSNQTSQAQSNLTAQANSTSAANTQGTQTAQANATNAVNQQNTQVAQTAVLQTSTAVAALTAAAQTAAAQTAAVQTSVAQQTANAAAQQTNVAQTVAASATAVADAKTAVLQTATATAAQATATAIASATAAAAPKALEIFSSPKNIIAGDGFDVAVAVLDASGTRSTASNIFVSLLQEGNPIALGKAFTVNGVANISVPTLTITRSGTIKMLATADFGGGVKPNSPQVSMEVIAQKADHISFVCYIKNGTTDCSPSPFSTPADQSFGFKIEARDQFGNIDKTYSGATLGVIDMALSPTDKRTITDPRPKFFQGVFSMNSITMDRPGVGNGFWFYVETDGTTKLNESTPPFEIVPGDPAKIEAISPTTQPVTVPPISFDGTPKFKVQLKDKLGNTVVAGKKVCFKALDPQPKDTDGYFVNYPTFGMRRLGSDGITIDTQGDGTAETPTFWANSQKGKYSLYAYNVPNATCSLTARDSEIKNLKNIFKFDLEQN